MAIANEIPLLFRAQDEISREWCFGLISITTEGKFIMMDLDHLGAYWDIDPKTIGRFTGIKDRNGEAIYEGDNMKQVCGPVKLADAGFCHGVVKYGIYGDAEVSDDSGIGFYLEIASQSIMPIKSNTFDYYIKIGTIHDNPELMSYKP